MDENSPIQMFQYARLKRNRKNGNWIKRQIAWVFWNNEHISALCEKWIRCDHAYAYTRFEELRAYSGELLLLESIRQSHQNVNQTSSKILISCKCLKILLLIDKMIIISFEEYLQQKQ